MILEIFAIYVDYNYRKQNAFLKALQIYKKHSVYTVLEPLLERFWIDKNNSHWRIEVAINNKSHIMVANYFDMAFFETVTSWSNWHFCQISRLEFSSKIVLFNSSFTISTKPLVTFNMHWPVTQVFRLIVFLDVSFLHFVFTSCTFQNIASYLNVHFRSHFLRWLSTLPVSTCLRNPYFLKLHDFSASHAYTWGFKTSKNNLIKNVTLSDFHTNPTLNPWPTFLLLLNQNAKVL